MCKLPVCVHASPEPSGSGADNFVRLLHTRFVLTRHVRLTLLQITRPRLTVTLELFATETPQVLC